MIHVYPYMMDFCEVVAAMEEALRRETKSGRLGYLFCFENLIIHAGFDISDSGDSQMCSRAMQVLKKKGLIQYRRSYRQWQNNLEREARLSKSRG